MRIRDGELQPWHFIYIYSIESRLMIRVRYDSHTLRGSGLEVRVEGSGFVG